MWSIGHRRPLAIALCSGLILLLLSSLYLAAWALPQCLASSCCEAGLSSSFPAGSRSKLGVWYWGCVRSSPTSSSEFVLLLVPVPLAPTALHLGSSLAIGCCRWAADRCMENINEKGGGDWGCCNWPSCGYKGWNEKKLPWTWTSIG